MALFEHVHIHLFEGMYMATWKSYFSLFMFILSMKVLSSMCHMQQK